MSGIYLEGDTVVGYLDFTDSSGNSATPTINSATLKIGGVASSTTVTPSISGGHVSFAATLSSADAMNPRAGIAITVNYTVSGATATQTIDVGQVGPVVAVEPILEAIFQQQPVFYIQGLSLGDTSPICYYLGQNGGFPEYGNANVILVTDGETWTLGVNAVIAGLTDYLAWTTPAYPQFSGSAPVVPYGSGVVWTQTSGTTATPRLVDATQTDCAAALAAYGTATSTEVLDGFTNIENDIDGILAKDIPQQAAENFAPNGLTVTGGDSSSPGQYLPYQVDANGYPSFYLSTDTNPPPLHTIYQNNDTSKWNLTTDGGTTNWVGPDVGDNPAGNYSSPPHPTAVVTISALASTNDIIQVTSSGVTAISQVYIAGTGTVQDDVYNLYLGVAWNGKLVFYNTSQSVAVYFSNVIGAWIAAVTPSAVITDTPTSYFLGGVGVYPTGGIWGGQGGYAGKSCRPNVQGMIPLLTAIANN